MEVLTDVLNWALNGVIEIMWVIWILVVPLMCLLVFASVRFGEHREQVVTPPVIWTEIGETGTGTDLGQFSPSPGVTCYTIGDKGISCITLPTPAPQ